MSQIKESALELVGGTPLLKAGRYAKKAGAEGATILAKLEYLNTAGSVKDRVALSMIEDAEEKGILEDFSKSIIGQNSSFVTELKPSKNHGIASSTK